MSRSSNGPTTGGMGLSMVYAEANRLRGGQPERQRPKKDLCAGGEDCGAAFAEADAGVAGCFAGAAEDDLVAVGEEGAGFAGGKEDGLRAVAGEFEETAGGGFGGAGDGARGENVADL